MFALSVLLWAGCIGESGEQVVLVELYAGEQAYVSVEAEACTDADDELLACYASLDGAVVDLGLDIDVVSVGPSSFCTCEAQLSVKAFDDVRSGSYDVPVEIAYEYYDSFFDDERDGAEDITLQIDVRGGL